MPRRTSLCVLYSVQQPMRRVHGGGVQARMYICEKDPPQSPRIAI